MSIDAFRDEMPEYAKDIKLNLSSVLSQPELTPRQIWGTAIASALTCGNKKLLQAIEAQATTVLSPEEIAAAKTAASIMGMTNIYYRFSHLAKDDDFSKMPSRLRMNSLRSHGVDQNDFELWCLAVSAITGCEMCVSSHWHHLQENGFGRDAVLAAVRIASVIHAASKN